MLVTVDLWTPQTTQVLASLVLVALSPLTTQFADGRTDLDVTVVGAAEMVLMDTGVMIVLVTPELSILSAASLFSGRLFSSTVPRYSNLTPVPTASRT